jgi:ketosteroid isomerase-like protein
MVRKALVLTILLAAGLPAQAPVQDVVDAELAFARFTAEHGIKEGFLAFLADDSIVFRPGPVSGREVYSKSPASPAYLSWYPVAADRAASGELGYTTGPYEYFKSKNEKTAAACGHYVTLWRKRTDGSWKAELDAGVSHAALPARPPVLQSRISVGPSASSDGAARAESDLAALEKSLNEGYIGRIGTLLASEARAYRDRRVPAAGRPDAMALIAGVAGTWTFSPARTIAAGSGDFAYVYGTAARLAEGPGGGQPETYAFLRIWKKAPGADWRVLLDLATSLQK